MRKAYRMYCCCLSWMVKSSITAHNICRLTEENMEQRSGLETTSVAAASKAHPPLHAWSVSVFVNNVLALLCTQTADYL